MKRYLMMTCTFWGLFAGCGGGSAFQSVEREAFAAKLSEEGVQLVDVRTPEEFDEGHIPGAVNIDVNGADFEEKICTLNPEKPLLLYCRSGRRSKLAAQKASKQGFQVTELEGGILSWQGPLEQ